MDLREEVNKLNIAISRIAGIYQKFEQQLGKNILQMRVLTAMYFDGLQTQKEICELYELPKYSLQGTTQGNGLTGGVPPVRFSM